MSFVPAPKVPTTPANTTGISMSVSVANKAGKSTVRFSLTSAAQERMFGRLIEPSKDRVDVQIGRGTDEGLALLRFHPKGEHEIKSGIKGSCSVRVGRWDLLPEHKRPAGSCRDLGDPEIQGDATCIMLSLPDWTSPKKREQAAMSAKRNAGGQA